jgi:hypothetical protein
MITGWIYNNPTWLCGTILVALFAVASCGGLFVFHWLVHIELRKAHDDLAGFIFAVVGGNLRRAARVHRHRHLGVVY